MSTDHGSLLKDSVSDFLARGTDIARVRALRDTEREYDRAIWRQMAELGWLGISVPERFGGMGLGLAETAIVAEGLARGLVPEPYTAAAVLAAGVLCGAENERLQDEWLPRIVNGEVIPALAWQEQAGTLDMNQIKARAVPFEGGYRLNGTKRYIAGAAGADLHIIAARAESGLVLACVERAAPGAAIELEGLADGRQFGTLKLEDVVVPRERVVAAGDIARNALERALDHATAIASAELYGVMGRALDMSVDYMKARTQFGRPIGSFQALQHRAVDLYIQRELASAVLEQGLRELDRAPPSHVRAATASRMKARCSDAALRITREAIQIHGAIGFTDEYDVGLYLKRALVLAAWLGNGATHRRRYAALALSNEDST